MLLCAILVELVIFFSITSGYCCFKSIFEFSHADHLKIQCFVQM